MSFFDRLKTTFSDNETPSAAKAAEAVPRSRFMGRDDDDKGVNQLPEKVVEKGLESPSMIWLYVAPGKQEPILVEDCGLAEGEPLSALMQSDLQRLGICEAVAYHAGFDKYWKMPSQESLVRMPGLYHVAALAVHRMRVHTKLVKGDEPQGLWLQVRVRTAHEVQMATEDTPMV